MKIAFSLIAVVIFTWLYINDGKLKISETPNMVGQFIKILPEGPHSEDFTFDSAKYTLYIRWEPWSPQSMINLSAGNILHSKLSSELNIIGLCSDWNDGIQEIKQARINFPIMFDQKLIFDEIFKVVDFPYYVLISPTHQVLWQSNSLDDVDIKQFIFNYERR